VKSTWPRFIEQLEAAGGTVPKFVETAFESYLTCGIAEEAGFLRLGCKQCGTERALPLSCKRRGICPSCGARRMHDIADGLMQRVLPDVPIRQYVLSPPSELVGLLGARTEPLSALLRIFVRAMFDGIVRRIDAGAPAHPGAVVVVQRFSKVIGLFPHAHVLALDGAYVEVGDDELEFRADPGPTNRDITDLEDEVERRFSRWLERHGYLEEEQDAEPLDDWFGPAVHDVVHGHRLPAKPRDPYRFQVHASVRVEAGDRRGREQLCAYVARPPLAEAQLEPLQEDRVRLWLRSPRRATKSSIVLTSMQLIRRLAWQVPPPNFHLVRYNGILAPAARLRHRVVPAGRVAIQGVWFQQRKFEPIVRPTSRVPWNRLLAKVFDVDAQLCPDCQGPMRPIGAVLPPRARAWIEQGRIRLLPPTGPPTHPSRQLTLPLAG
jgi:hypothetical protein